MSSTPKLKRSTAEARVARVDRIRWVKMVSGLMALGTIAALLTLNLLLNGP